MRIVRRLGLVLVAVVFVFVYFGVIVRDAASFIQEYQVLDIYYIIILIYEYFIVMYNYLSTSQVSYMNFFLLFWDYYEYGNIQK